MRRKGTITRFDRGIGVVTLDSGGTVNIHSCCCVDGELRAGMRVAVEGVDFPPRVFRLREPMVEVPPVAPKPPSLAAGATDGRSGLQHAVDDLLDGQGDCES